MMATRSPVPIRRSTPSTRADSALAIDVDQAFDGEVRHRQPPATRRTNARSMVAAGDSRLAGHAADAHRRRLCDAQRVHRGIRQDALRGTFERDATLVERDHAAGRPRPAGRPSARRSGSTRPRLPAVQRRPRQAASPRGRAARSARPGSGGAGRAPGGRRWRPAAAVRPIADPGRDRRAARIAARRSTTRCARRTSSRATPRFIGPKAISS